MRNSWVLIHPGLQMKWGGLCVCVNIAHNSLNYGQWMQMIWQMKMSHICHNFLFTWQMNSLASHGEVVFPSCTRNALTWMNTFSFHFLWAPFLELVILGGVSDRRPPRKGCVLASGVLKFILLLSSGCELYSSFISTHTGCWTHFLQAAWTSFPVSCWDCNPTIPVIRTRAVVDLLAKWMDGERCLKSSWPLVGLEDVRWQCCWSYLCVTDWAQRYC